MDSTQNRTDMIAPVRIYGIVAARPCLRRGEGRAMAGGGLRDALLTPLLSASCCNARLLLLRCVAGSLTFDVNVALQCTLNAGI